MLQAEREWFIKDLRTRYGRAGKGEKGELLDTAQEHLKLSRRQVRRLLAPLGTGRPRNPLRTGRPGKYQSYDFRTALKGLWREMHYMCSRHLHAAIPEWLPHIEQQRGKAFEDEIRALLLQISPSSIDRVLRRFKGKKGKATTRSGGFREQIPIQENVWDIQQPGFFEADTAAHCGGSTSGEYISSLVMVDIASIWTEARPIFGKASKGVVLALEDIESSIPIAMLGYDSDNGTEVLNSHVLRYFTSERTERNRPPVQVTRSREYKKNDQAHVEQRNDSLARRWLGYERLDFPELVPLINHYYKFILCPLLNHFFPVFKLHDKVRVKSRTRRIYQKPITPYARLLASAHVPEQDKQILKSIHSQLSPVQLSREEKACRIQIDNALRALKNHSCSPQLLNPPKPHPALQNNVFSFSISQTSMLPIYKSDT